MARSIRGIPVTDLVTGAGLVVLGQVELWLPVLDQDLVAERLQVLPFALLAPAGVALRRRAPLVAVAVTSGSAMAQAFAAAPAMTVVQLVSILAVVYAVGAHLGAWSSVAGLLMACLAPVTMARMTSGSWLDLAPIAVFAGAPWLAGRTVRRVRHYAALLEQTTAALEFERSRTADLAIVETRAHIARELHDVLAHGVGVMTLQAGGARRLVERDPVRVKAALEQIERAGREALDELRRLLNTLDPREEPGIAEPQPGLEATCKRLLDAMTDLQPLDIEVSGTPTALPSGLEQAASRILQEAVANATRHAPGSPIRVNIDHTTTELALTVHNARGARTESVPGGGRGLIGMRERVALYGGSFEAGPSPEGFLVRARLPVDGVAP